MITVSSQIAGDAPGAVVEFVPTGHAGFDALEGMELVHAPPNVARHDGSRNRDRNNCRTASNRGHQELIVTSRRGRSSGIETWLPV